MISIIVPIYNVEKYLPKCIESILAQTYRDFELILVDDGSPDRCPQICDEFGRRDKRIIVIHQKNAGVSAARNAGLAIAKGEYIGFVDSDDYIDKNMYEKLHVQFLKHNIELSICGYQYLNESGEVTRNYNLSGSELINQSELFKRYFDMPPSIRMVIWNKLFRRDLINNLFFDEELKGAEDGKFLADYFRKVKHASIIHVPLYYNVERKGSATRGGLGVDSVIPALNVYHAVAKEMLSLYPKLRHHTQFYYMDACLLNYGIHNGKNNKELRNEIRKRVASEFPSAFFNREIYWKTRIYYFLFVLGHKG